MVTKTETWTQAPNIDAINAIALTIPSATTAQLTDLASDANTIDKKAGSIVFNSTTGAVVVSTGATAGSVWNTAAGALAHTPA